MMSVHENSMKFFKTLTQNHHMVQKSHVWEIMQRFKHDVYTSCLLQHSTKHSRNGNKPNKSNGTDKGNLQAGTLVLSSGPTLRSKQSGGVHLSS